VTPVETIVKSPSAVRPNLANYEAARAEFSWDAVREELRGPGGERNHNIAWVAIDRHAEGPLCDHLAIRWLGKKGRTINFTYGDLRDATNRFAQVLESLGLERNERVFALAGRIPELYIAALGTLKRGAVFCPLFSAFGPEPIRQRMAIGQGRVLVTTEALYKIKVAPIRDSLPDLRHVLLVGRDGARTDIEGTHDLHRLLDEASDAYTIPPTGPEDMALLHFTSGTTGRPKGAVHVHQAVLNHYLTGKYALDFHSEDVFWCTADPGWVTGTSYGIISPLTHAITSVIDEGDFDAERWYAQLEHEKISVWYTAPTAVRMMMRVGKEAVARHDLSSLRFIASVGEPLHPEAVLWGREVFGLPIHDNWWQTETGGIMIANYLAMDIRPGSMGRPIPGVEAAIVRRRAGNRVEVIEEPGVEGDLALKPGWPSMFREYLHEHERYQSCFVDGWYLSGDLARRDADGYFWFIGREDDVIKSAGHLIGPFEVESALMEHPAVAGAGVIGKPDPIAGAVVKAFVVLHDGFEAGEELRMEIMGFARKRLGPAVAPREIEFTDALPETRSGKIMRRLLKARELGLPEGDTSTLEGKGG
jgi:acetyl-CoA synthetase